MKLKFYKVLILERNTTCTYSSDRDFPLYSMVYVPWGVFNYKKLGIISSVSDYTDLKVKIKNIYSLEMEASSYCLYLKDMFNSYNNLYPVVSVGIKYCLSNKNFNSVENEPSFFVSLDSVNSDILLKLHNSVNRQLRLSGYPGSGKTYRSTQIINYLASKGNNVLYILPEMVLLNYVAHYFNREVITYYGGLTLTQKHKIIQKWNNTKGNVILATRSALLTPLNGIDYVFIDEIHDSSYDQYSYTFYNSLDILKKCSLIYRFYIVWITATLSFNTYRKLRHVQFYKLPGILKSPDVYNTRFLKVKIPLLPNDALVRIKETIQKNKLSIIFLNRRGHSNIVECNDCLSLQQCKHCKSKLVYHSDENILKCHKCNTGYELKCQNCNSADLRLKGVGVERIAKQLKLVCGDTIKICSSDYLPTKNKILQFINNINNDHYSVIITTSIFIKGYHINKVANLVILDLNIEKPFLKNNLDDYYVIKQLIGRLSNNGTLDFIYLKWDGMYNHIRNKTMYEKSLSDKFTILEQSTKSISFISTSKLDAKYLKKRLFENYNINSSLVKTYYNNYAYIVTLNLLKYIEIEKLNKLYYWLNLDHYNNF